MNATKTIVTKAISRALLWTGIVMIVTCLANMYTTNTTFDKPTPRYSPAGVIENFGADFCQPTVKGEFPTYVVYQKFNGGTFVSSSSVDVGKALDDLFADKPWKGYRVLYFCK